MVGFSVIDAALEGIRLTREKPRVVLLWGLYYIAFILVLAVIAYLTLGAHMAELLTTMQHPPKDPAAMERLINTVSPFLNIAGPVGMVFQASFTAAIYRRILRPDDARTGLRLGLDELRLLGVFLILMFVTMAVIFAIQLAFVTTAGVPAPLAFAVLAAVLAASVWVLIRLSLVGSATYVRRRLSILESWRLTDGQSWRLLATYLLAGVLAVVVLLLMQVVVVKLFQIVQLVTGVSVAGGGPLALTAFAVLEAISALIATCAYVIVQAPPAAAYVALAGEA
jgi:hypothetical protein